MTQPTTPNQTQPPVPGPIGQTVAPVDFFKHMPNGGATVNHPEPPTPAPVSPAHWFRRAPNGGTTYTKPVVAPSTNHTTGETR